MGILPELISVSSCSTEMENRKARFGLVTMCIGGGSDNIISNPTSGSKAGETVTVILTLTAGILGENDATLSNPVTWQFVVDAPQGLRLFLRQGQFLGSLSSHYVSPRDFDGGGDLDAFVTNDSGVNMVWLKWR